MKKEEIEKRVLEQMNKIIEMRESKKLTPKAIQKELGIPEYVYRYRLVKAREIGRITKKEFDKLKYKPKLNKEIVRRIVDDWVIEGIVSSKIMKKYSIGHATFSIAIWQGVHKYHFITEEEREDSEKYFEGLDYKNQLKRYGKKAMKKKFSDMWHNGIGNDHKALVKAAKAGGDKTQETIDKHPHVLENLKNSKMYGTQLKPKYKGEEFESEKELWTGLMLLKSGKLKKIKRGINYQVPFGENGKKRIDYVIRIDGEKCAVDWHPVAKGLGNENYVEDRTQDLTNYGFKPCILERDSDFYEKGIIKVLLNYFRTKRIVDEKLEKIMEREKELAEVPF